MKKILFAVLVLLFISNRSEAQIIKVSTGFNHSSMDDNQYDILTRKKAGFNLLAGIDYFEHNHFYLSSQIGYISTGAKEKIYVYAPNGQYESALDLSVRISNIHFNTTIRGKLDFNDWSIFLGVGPFVNYQMHTHYKNFEADFEPYGFPKKLIWGIKPEAGLSYYFDRYYIGAEYFHLLNLTKANGSRTNRSDAFNLTFGYIL